MDIRIDEIENGFTVSIKHSEHGKEKKFIADSLKKAMIIINEKAKVRFKDVR